MKYRGQRIESVRGAPSLRLPRRERRLQRGALAFIRFKA
jgi:hypothetical protein